MPGIYERCKVSTRQHKPPKQARPIPEDIMVELREEVFRHRHVTSHKSAEQVARAAEVVRALRRKGGLSTLLDPSQVEAVVAAMSNGRLRLDPGAVREALSRRFSDEERVELYERLSNDLSPAYGYRGQARTVSLADAAWSNGAPGFCRLVKVWLRPPVLAPTAPPPPRVASDLEAPARMAREVLGLEPSPYLLSALRELKEHHEASVRPMLERLGASRGMQFGFWLGGLLRAARARAEASGERAHAGWVRMGSPAFLEWEAELAALAREEGRARARALGRACAEREAGEREGAFREAWGAR